MTKEEIWQNRKEAEEINRELGELQNLVNKWKELNRRIKEIEDLASITQESETEILEGLRKETELIKKELKELEITQLFSNKYDRGAAIISIFAGVGGQDAEDWTAMLAEMYTRFANKKNWGIKVIDESYGNFQSKTGLVPIKHITFEIEGSYVYGHLKNEAGVHRLVRISPFSPKKLRHTSFALVEVLPEISEVEEKNIVLKPEDLKIEMFRSSGPGGQNVNRRETAVRVVHLPTGIAVASQVERSQARNREQAMKLLRAKLFKLMEQTRVKELKELRGKRVIPEWGSQIRSYVLHPYKLVKDHRTGVETSQVDEVLNGNLDKFIEAELKLVY